MKVLFVNPPNTRRDAGGNLLEVGPNAGSRWPFLGITPGCYAPMPMYLSFATSYLRAFDIDAHLLDCVAEKRWHPLAWNIGDHNPDIVVYEVSKPVLSDVLMMAKLSHNNGRKVVLCGPHCASDAERLAALSYVDHVIVGEYELPMLEICHGGKEKIYRYLHVDDLNMVEDKPWHPYRPVSTLAEYYDPSEDTPKCQLWVMTSRGCAFHCNYCQWQKVLNNKTYRARSVEAVEAEILDAIASVQDSARLLADTWITAKNKPTDEVRVRSLFFDDDTWNLGGSKRINAMCEMLKRVNLPWTMLGRLDVHGLDLFDLMVESGCVGMRFGVESFCQKALDMTGGKRNATKQYDAAKHILSRHRGLELHFTSMRDMPGQTEADWLADGVVFDELRRIGEGNGNKVHYQISHEMPFPGTDLEEQLRAAGHGAMLDAADFNGNGSKDGTELNRVVREFVPLTIGRK